jgi:hypothetical protein
MHRTDIGHLLVVLASTAIVALIGLWSWNTLAALLELPAAGFRHALAALAMLAVLGSVLLPRRDRRRRRLPCPGSRGSST